MTIAEIYLENSQISRNKPLSNSPQIKEKVARKKKRKYFELNESKIATYQNFRDTAK